MGKHSLDHHNSLKHKSDRHQVGFHAFSKYALSNHPCPCFCSHNMRTWMFMYLLLILLLSTPEGSHFFLFAPLSFHCTKSILLCAYSDFLFWFLGCKCILIFEYSFFGQAKHSFYNHLFWMTVYTKDIWNYCFFLNLKCTDDKENGDIYLAGKGFL